MTSLVASKWKQYREPPASATSSTHWDRVNISGRGTWKYPTFSGCDTIIWQSINIPGTPLETEARMGGPMKGYVFEFDWSMNESLPMVMLGTKWLFIG
jgi:hypothetical protein